MAFAGFSTDTLVGLPPELFSEVIPCITLPSELKVTLQIFYRLSRQRATPRRLSWDDLVADRTLRCSLRSVSKLRPIEELLAEGLEAAVRRGTVLHLALPEGGAPATGIWSTPPPTASGPSVSPPRRWRSPQLARSPPSVRR